STPLPEQKITNKTAPACRPRWHEVIPTLHGMIEVLQAVMTTLGLTDHAFLNGLVLVQVRLVADEQQPGLEGRPKGIRATVDFDITSAKLHIAFLFVACRGGVGILRAVGLPTAYGVFLCLERELVPSGHVLADLAEEHV